MAETSGEPRLRPRAIVPVIGTVLGAAAGFAYYYFFGCESG